MQSHDLVCICKGIITQLFHVVGMILMGMDMN